MANINSDHNWKQRAENVLDVALIIILYEKFAPIGRKHDWIIAKDYLILISDEVPLMTLNIKEFYRSLCRNKKFGARMTELRKRFKEKYLNNG